MKTIKLTQGKFALVDDKDFEWLNQYKWCYVRTKQGRGYVRTHEHKTNKGLFLHRVIMGNPIDKEVDHVNGDALDNRRKNLRIVTRSQNNMNRIKIRNKHGFKGIYFQNRRYKKKSNRKTIFNHWKSSISFNGKRIKLGSFSTKEQAAHAYNLAATKYFGQFARLNLIPQL